MRYIKVIFVIGILLVGAIILPISAKNKQLSNSSTTEIDNISDELYLKKGSSMDWWNNNWLYRKELQLSDPTIGYQMWIKILEGHYMTLFQSPEYVKTLGKTLDAMAEFSAANNDVMADMLNILPISTQKDMDDLYKEIYLLKKRIKHRFVPYLF